MRHCRITRIHWVLCLLMGCGRQATFDISGPTGTVSGKATLNGQPVSSGCTVSFRHTKSAHTAYGQVSADGEYNLQLAESLKLPVGVYLVAVTPPIQPKLPPEEAMKDAMANKPKNEEQKIPIKYFNPDTSTLQLEVIEGPNTLDVKLSSE